MTDDDRPRRGAAFWGWVKAVSYSIPWWIAAISAYFSQEAAFRVFQTESKRLSFETTRYTHQTYRDYVSFRHKKENRLSSKCIRHLVERASDKAGGYLVSNDELIWIFETVPRSVPQYDKTRHAALAPCADDTELELLAKAGLGGSDEEKAKALETIRQAVGGKIGWNITVLDAELVGYAHAKADKTIVCENFSGFLQSDLQLKELGYGVFGQFLWRMMGREIDLIRSENYPNLFRFVTDLAAISSNFTAHIDCAKLPSPPSSEPTRLDWARELLGAGRR